MKTLKNKIIDFCVWLGVKWYMAKINIRLKAIEWTYKMNDKLKDR